MFDHGEDGRTGVLRVDHDARVATGEHAKHFIRKSLSHGAYVTKVEADFSELLQIGQ